MVGEAGCKERARKGSSPVRIRGFWGDPLPSPIPALILGRVWWVRWLQFPHPETHSPHGLIPALPSFLWGAQGFSQATWVWTGVPPPPPHGDQRGSLASVSSPVAWGLWMSRQSRTWTRERSVTLSCGPVSVLVHTRAEGGVGEPRAAGLMGQRKHRRPGLLDPKGWLYFTRNILFLFRLWEKQNCLNRHPSTIKTVPTSIITISPLRTELAFSFRVFSASSCCLDFSGTRNFSGSTLTLELNWAMSSCCTKHL